MLPVKSCTGVGVMYKPGKTVEQRQDSLALSQHWGNSSGVGRCAWPWGKPLPLAGLNA